MTDTNKQEFSTWAIVEIMGHQVVAGRVSEQFIAGAGFIRLDIPEVDGRGGTGELLSPKAIFRMRATTEAIAREFIARMQPDTLSLFAKHGAPMPALTMPAIVRPDDDGDPPDDDDEDVPF